MLRAIDFDDARWKKVVVNREVLLTWRQNKKKRLQTMEGQERLQRRNSSSVSKRRTVWRIIGERAMDDRWAKERCEGRFEVGEVE